MDPIRLNLPLLRHPAAVSRSFPQEFAPLLQRARTAAFLEFTPAEADEDPLVTKLAGQPYLPVGEPWPTCDHCGRPMHHLFQINFAEAGFPALTGVTLLTFFYCIGCSPEDYTQPGWTIRLRKDVDAPAAHHLLPAVPPQVAQLLPIVLRENRPQTATTRIGPDLPNEYDPEVRRVVGQIEADSPFAYAAPFGVTHYFRARVRMEAEEAVELTVPMTYAPADPEEWARQTFADYQVEHVEIHPVLRPRNPDPWHEYQHYLDELDGSKDRPVSKIGGWLHEIQDPRFSRCECGQPLEHIVTIRTNNDTPYVIGDVGAIYLTGCPSPDCQHGGLHWWVGWA